MLVVPARAAELKPETVAAFDHYIQASEARMAEGLAEDRFLSSMAHPMGAGSRFMRKSGRARSISKSFTLKKTVDRSGFLVV